MSFARKVFISVFMTTLVLGSALIWAAHNYVAKQTEENFISRYSVFSRIIGDTLTQLDASTEALMLNAAKVVAARDAEKGTLSTEALKALRSEINVTHIFVVDKLGNFIRSTNEDPKLIPNAYSFCPAYRGLTAGKTSVEATPIIHPQPEPKPYKFLFVPSYDRQRLLEVGVRVDFITKTLTQAMGSDANLVSMSLYSPNGVSFGRFDTKEVNFNGGAITLPASFPTIVDESGNYRFFTKVKSSHPQCCQCDVSKTSRNGEYYYVLASEISKKELVAAQATSRNAFLLLALLNVILAYGFSRFVARRLVKNIETAVGKVRAIKETGDFQGRINLEGKDEVTYLTNEFDRLLDSLNESQQKIIEGEMVQAKVQLARDVAHNIKSPIVAIEMMLPMLARLPQNTQKVFYDSVKEIKALAARLSRKADALAGEPTNGKSLESVNVAVALEGIVRKKQVEYLTRFDIDIFFEKPANHQEIFAHLDLVEFLCVISNIINNAMDSYGSKGGAITISLTSDSQLAVISISDCGKGIPADRLQILGKAGIASEKVDGRGLGLAHAFRQVSYWGGKIAIESDVGRGTTVTISLPKVTIGTALATDREGTWLAEQSS